MSNITLKNSGYKCPKWWWQGCVYRSRLLVNYIGWGTMGIKSTE